MSTNAPDTAKYNQLHQGARFSVTEVGVRQNGFHDPELEHLLSRARLEAEALAWSTGVPQLVLPCLLAEKESDARAYWRRQQFIREQSVGILQQTNPESLRLAA